MDKRSIIMFVAVTFGILLGVTALLWNFGGKSGVETQIADAPGEMRRVKGSGDVVVTEFSDLQCPACKSVQEPLEQILAKYEGKVRLVFRHFPLPSIHKNAQMAAQAAEAAGNQDKFWEMHDLLYDKQAEWGGEVDAITKFAEYAESLGMEREKFLSDINSSLIKEAVSTDFVAATRYKLQGTPTFFVNGYQTEFGELEAKIIEFVK